MDAETDHGVEEDAVGNLELTATPSKLVGETSVCIEGEKDDSLVSETPVEGFEKITPRLPKPVENLCNVQAILENQCNVSHKGNLRWKCVCPALLWLFWKERNSRVFEEECTPLERLVSQARELALSWVLEDSVMKGSRDEEGVFDWERLLLT